MRKCVLLKIQLAEAAKYAAKEEVPYKRLAVIMLDNFIELQVSSLLQAKLYTSILIEPSARRKEQKEVDRAMKSFDALLSLSEKKEIITSEERYQLAFCHKIRNNLYHHAKEEMLLIKVALHILHDIIVQRQPKWKNATIGTGFYSDDKDPFYEKGGLPIIGYNTEEMWRDFLEKHFSFLLTEDEPIQTLLSKSLQNKIDEIRYYFVDFIDQEYSCFHPEAENWDFNDYVMRYAYKHIEKERIEQLHKIENKEERIAAKIQLDKEYYSKWKKKDLKRIDAIEQKAVEMNTLTPYHALQRYDSLSPELNLIHTAISDAASYLDGRIQHEMDVARGK